MRRCKVSEDLLCVVRGFGYKWQVRVGKGAASTAAPRHQHLPTLFTTRAAPTVPIRPQLTAENSVAPETWGKHGSHDFRNNTKWELSRLLRQKKTQVLETASHILRPAPQLPDSRFGQYDPPRLPDPVSHADTNRPGLQVQIHYFTSPSRSGAGSLLHRAPSLLRLLDLVHLHLLDVRAQQHVHEAGLSHAHWNL